MRAGVPFLIRNHTDKGKQCHTSGAGGELKTRASCGIEATQPLASTV
jgi:hypothetical protein